MHSGSLPASEASDAVCARHMYEVRISVRP